MKKYIDADKAIDTAKKQVIEQMAITNDKDYDEFLGSFLRFFAHVIDNTPAADVEEVKHGKWDEQGIHNFKCSCCGEVEKYESPFCRWCGAKMDGR